jgi:hypothetical protein
MIGMSKTKAECTCPDRAYPSEWKSFYVFPVGDPRNDLPMANKVRHLEGCPAAQNLVQVDA